MRETLHNDAVSISRVRDADAPEIYAAVRDSIQHLLPWMPWCYPEYSLQDTETFVAKQIEQWESSEEYSFAIRNQENLLVGLCGLNQFNHIHHLANLGYWLRQSCLGRGYATAATRLLAEFGLNDLNLQRVEILVAVDNYPSQRVAERANATCEGILHNRLWLRDRAHDAVCYSFVREGSGLQQIV
jgi:ribosomal-protein-serine acetyltransferase